MSDLAQLQQRVERAEQRFGAIGTQHGKYSARLVELMDRIERQSTERQQEIEVYVAEIARLRQEYDQVKKMLQDLLHAIETGGAETLTETLRELDRRASAILGAGAAAPTASAEPIAFPVRFEDVSATELEAETTAELAADVADATEDAPQQSFSGLGNSPVAEIIERISQLTRALVEVDTPLPQAEAETESDAETGGEADAEPDETVRRIA